MPLIPVSIRIPEGLLGKLQLEAEKKQMTVSDVLRERVTQPEGKVAARAELLARVDQLERQVSSIGKEITLVAAAQETLAATADSIKENLARLVELLNQEKNFPFGMNRKFVQVATMASFALARGTFSNSPEAWEPYKEEARTRAFKSGEGDP